VICRAVKPYSPVEVIPEWTPIYIPSNIGRLVCIPVIISETWLVISSTYKSSMKSFNTGSVVKVM
jgi:hypothetical protein